jgi:hypothetical protein
MWNEIAAWQETLTHRPDLSAKTIALYTQDARRFAIWLQSEHPGLKATEITVQKTCFLEANRIS